MENNNSCCCAPGRKTKRKDCAICGKPLVYFSDEKQMECAICHKRKPANAACEAGHFVCDDCHSGGGAARCSGSISKTASPGTSRGRPDTAHRPAFPGLLRRKKGAVAKLSFCNGFFRLRNKYF